MNKINPKEILIAAITPSFLEKGVSWFSENFEKIKIQARKQSWWQDNTLFCQAGQQIKISEFLRKITEMGYEKNQMASAPGEFSYLGGLITIWPINSKVFFNLEWLGNVIEQIAARSPQKEKNQKLFKKLESLKIKEKFQLGDFVVHLDHGIGRLAGLEENYLVIEYAAPRPGAPQDKLFLPENQVKKISPYLGFEEPQIYRLGSQTWFNTKKRIKEETVKVAQELIKIYAQREMASKTPMITDGVIEKALIEDFEYIETSDQTKVWQEIEADLAQPKPMDRLICGDVGFGKTEIAIRAALKAAVAGYQTAVLTPTTILAEQHFQTFSKRLDKFPVSCAGLSRLTSKTLQKEIIKKLSLGQIDIILGTHRLLSQDIKIPKLGLVIVDEEQRFGVRQKEKLKKLRISTDILSLSATPIPRTLYLAMSNLRDVSQIKTPPPERLEVKTFVLPYSEKIIKGAIEKELKRNGQIYFLHNRVQTIRAVQQKLLKIKPDLKIGILHGRMPEKEIISAMGKFKNRQTQLLLATSIIENGLDFSNANTLIVDNAARLGLAQAYQIKGRIGRSNIQAYAYFLYQSKSLDFKAKERLKALERYQGLGSGFDIAKKDLEIRGAGNILGAKQSGHINAIGLNLYCQLLAQTIEELKNETSL